MKALQQDAVPYEFQVEKPVVLQSGTVMPKYPDILRQAGVEGEVLVSFVVDEQGSADAASFKVIRATHELFATAVKQALPAMRFVAAELGGKKVKQMVQQPFSFTLPGIEPKAGQQEEGAVFTEGKKLAYTVDRPQGAEASWEEKKSPPTLILRSARSRYPGSSPLLIVDGVIMTGDMKEIDPQTIESIEVVKGPAAVSTYGARAQNGVVQITTKSRRRVP